MRKPTKERSEVKGYKIFAVIGIFVTVASLGGVAWNRFDYIRADQARIEGVEAAGIGLLAALLGLAILYWIAMPFLPKSLRFRGKNKS